MNFQLETKNTTAYIVVAHYENHQAHTPKNDMEKELVEKLQKMGFKTYQIRILFERLGAGKLILEIDKVLLSSQVSNRETPFQKLMKVLKTRYNLQFNNDQLTNRMKGVKDLQKYVRYLEKNGIKWTYFNVYDGESRLKIGSLYHDEPIPKRMIE